jgi:hypothetical protein
MHCVDRSPCKNARERRVCAEHFAKTANYKLLPDFNAEYEQTEAAKSVKTASAQAKTTKREEGDSETPLIFGSTVPAAMTELQTKKSELSESDQFDASISISEDSMCFSEFIDDEPTVVEPTGPTEHENLRPQLDKLEAKIMNVARRKTSPAPTRQKLNEMTPQTTCTARAVANSPRDERYSHAMPSQAAAADKRSQTKGQGEETQPRQEQNDHHVHSGQEHEDYDDEDDDSARSSMSSITCTIFLKSAKATGRGGRLGSSGPAGLSPFSERPQSTADKMESLARVMPYAADASRGTHKMPLSLAHNSQVKEMAAMLSLPMFCKKTTPPVQGVSSKSSRSRRSVGSVSQRQLTKQLDGIQER